MKSSALDLSIIPTDWDVIPCGYFFKEKSIKNNFGEINLSVYRDYGVIPRDSRDDNHNRVSEDISNYKLVDRGDFVLNKMKCWSGSLGVSNYRGIVSPSYTVLEPKREIHNQYFHYLLRSEGYRQIYESLSYGVRVDQWELRFHNFKVIPALYPKIKEQKLISKYLDKKTQKIESLIYKIENKIELLKEHKTALINKYVTNGLDPICERKDSGVLWIGKIPKHWKVSKFNFKVKLRHGYQFRDYDFVESGIKIIKITQLDKNGSLNLSNCSSIDLRRKDSFKDIIIKKNDILMCLTGGTIGKIVMVKNVNEILLQNYRVGQFSSLDDSSLLNEFLFYLLTSNVIQEQISFHIRETGQPNIGIEDMKKMFITIPPIKEQKLIVKSLNNEFNFFEKLINFEKEKISLYREYRDSLISSVVTGKIRITADMI